MKRLLTVAFKIKIFENPKFLITECLLAVLSSGTREQLVPPDVIR